MTALKIVKERLEMLDVLAGMRKPYHEAYYAMYSTVWDAIVTDPVLMTVPMDDHMVHRGDGVFETFKCVEGNLYNMGAHMDRLLHSASALQLGLPCPKNTMNKIIVETVRAGGHRNCYVRVFLSRGPGGFGVDPYESPASQLYVVVCRMNTPFMESHPGGAKVRTSMIGVKPGFLASVKSCNYIPNVLMKREAVDAGVDFVAAYDERGFLAEGATENFGIVTGEGALLVPRLDRILPGTTMLRVMELAERLVRKGALSRIGYEDITREQVRGARELLVMGTTTNVTAAVSYDGKPIAGGKPGPIQTQLDALLREDMRTGQGCLTPV